MRRCMAVGAWLSCSLIVCCFVGCASLRNEDPLSSYNLPGEVDPDDGIFTEMTKGLGEATRSAMGIGPNEDAAKQKFAEAMSIYREASKLPPGESRRAEFDRAAKGFARAATRWPKSSIEEDAMFYRAESFFFADRYPKADLVFGELVSKYINTKHIDKVSQRRFQIAKFWLDHHELREEPAVMPNFLARERPRFDKFGNAIKVLERIRLDDPTGELADDATMLAAEACFKDKRLYRADELLNDLRRSFPNSQHQYAAHMLGLKCKTQLYQGPNYAAGPLEDAEELIRQMRRQFPKEAANDTDFLARAFKDVRMNRALREMNLARYRDRRQEYRAARLQYDRVVREFSDTSLAAEAEERLAQLDGRPDLPPQRLEWLARAFPSNSNEQPLIATRPTTTQR